MSSGVGRVSGGIVDEPKIRRAVCIKTGLVIVPLCLCFQLAIERKVGKRALIVTAERTALHGTRNDPAGNAK